MLFLYCLSMLPLSLFLVRFSLSLSVSFPFNHFDHAILPIQTLTLTHTHTCPLLSSMSLLHCFSLVSRPPPSLFLPFFPEVSGALYKKRLLPQPVFFGLSASPLPPGTNNPSAMPFQTNIGPHPKNLKHRPKIFAPSTR